MRLNREQAGRLKNLILRKELTNKDIAEQLNVNTRYVEFLLLGQSGLRLIHLQKLVEYLGTEIDYIIYGHDKFNPSHHIYDDSNIKYFTVLEQIVKSKDYEYVQSNIETLAYKKDFNDDYLINVAIRYNDIEMIKIILKQMVFDDKDADHNFIKNMRYKYGKKMAQLDNQLIACGISNNDVEFFHYVNTLQVRSQGSALYFGSNMEVLNAILGQSTSIEMFEFIIRNNMITLEALFQYCVDIRHIDAIEKLLSLYTAKHPFENTIKLNYIKKFYQLDYEKTPGNLEFNILNFECDLDYAFEQAAYTSDFEMMDILSKYSQNAAIKYSLLSGQIDFVRRYDDGKMWDRKKTPHNLEKGEVPDNHINLFLAVPDGKYEYALLSQNAEIIRYAIEKSGQDICCEEAIVFGDLDLVKETFDKNEPLTKIKSVRNMGLEELRLFAKNNMSKKGVVLNSKDRDEEDVEYAERFIQNYLGDGLEIKHAEAKDRIINDLQLLSLETFESEYANSNLIQKIYNIRTLTFEPIGLDFACETRKYDIARYLIELSTTEQLRSSHAKTKEKVLDKDFEETIAKITVRENSNKDAFDLYKDVSEILESKKSSTIFLATTMEMIEEFYPALSSGMYESMNNLIAKVYTKYTDQLKDEKFYYYLRVGFERFPLSVRDGIMFFGDLVSGKKKETAEKVMSKVVADKVKYRTRFNF